MKNKKIFLIVASLLFAFLTNYYAINLKKENYNSYDMQNIADYAGEKYVYVNDNVPEFDSNDYTITSFEKYSDLDRLGRCRIAYANIGIDLMPTEERDSIGMIKPSGWQLVKYDNVAGKYLYNRCHLIGYQLTGENANKKNLITCTRQMNTEVMLEFENLVANYIKETSNHVLYRVTPLFKDDNLLAAGVKIEAYSVEDDGEGISFNVFIYNVQDGININYKDGTSKLKWKL